MMVSDEILNRAAAAACGWKNSGAYWFTPQGGLVVGCPMFCQDRNALPELLAAVQTAGRYCEFGEILMGDRLNEEAVYSALDILQKSGRDIVIAALKSLGRWDAGWDTQETEAEHDERRVYESGMSWLKQPE